MKALTQSILYFGANSSASTSRHRADALRRLGCKVTIVDPQTLIGPRHPWQVFLDYRTGYRWLQRRLLTAIQAWASDSEVSPDLIWIDSGELFGPGVMRWLVRRFSPSPIILYNVDDPTGFRDAMRFQSLLASIPFCTLCVFVRAETALEALAWGATKVLLIHRSYDEIHHTPQASAAPEDVQQVVSFIGTLIPGEPRDSFMLSLLQAGLPLKLIGSRWQRSTHWPLLRSIHQGLGLAGHAYAQALGSPAVTLGLLSHQNRDLITTRSLEAPACRGLLCAERTSEHQLLYEDGQEAVFWSSTDECVEQCRLLLAEPQRNASIRLAGSQQVYSLGVGNEDICRQILAAV